MTASLDPSGDRSEIRELVERYASAADRCDGAAAAALFTNDGEFELWLDPQSAEPTSLRRGHAEIAAAIDGLERFAATQHVIAHSTVDVDGDSATGETRCAAHHVSRDESGSWDRTLYIRYLDRFARIDGRWRLARRELRVQWSAIQPVESI